MFNGSVAEAIAAFRADRARLESLGITWEPGAEPIGYATADSARDFTIAMDAVSTVPALSGDPNSSIPAMLSTLIDPEIYEIQFAPIMAAEIMGEVRKGTWVDDTTMFPVEEATGEVSSYGDFNENARSGVNYNWPQVQSYLFQTILEYGERAIARVGLARVNYVAGIGRAAATNLNRFSNTCYFFGVTGQQNYGLLNNPFLAAPLSPSTKANGGVTWFVSGTTTPNATANEVYNDILSLVQELITNNAGLVTAESEFTLAIPPQVSTALNFTNTFNVNVRTLLTSNFPKMKIKQAPQYGARSAQNNQGVLAGNFMQLIATEVNGQRTGFCAYNEKQRSFPIIRMMSAFKQKQISGSWGTILRYPAGITSMLGF